MKKSRFILFVLPLAATPLAHAQGPLIPPGAPGATMRSLDQIEPRVPLVSGSPGVAVTANGNITINQAGSYVLTGNLSPTAGNGITISAGNVSVDLRGFAVDSNNAGGTAIFSGQNNVSITNGTINRWTSRGLDLSGTGVRVSNITISNTGERAMSIAGRGAVIESCTVHTCASGIEADNSAPDNAVVTRCSVYGINSSTLLSVSGITAGTVTDCNVRQVNNSNASATQIRGIDAVLVTNCQVADVQGAAGFLIGIAASTVESSGYTGTPSPTASAASQYGISAQVVNRCSVRSMIANTSSTIVSGIFATNVTGCTVERVNNTGSGTLASGIAASSMSNAAGNSFSDTALVKDCNISGITAANSTGGYGIRISGNGLVTDNRVGYCTQTGITLTNGILRGNTTTQVTGTGMNLSNGFATGNVSIGDTTAFVFGASVRSGPTLTTGGVGSSFDPNSNLDL